MIADFEREHEMVIPDEQKRFLQDVANGGRPVRNYTVPTRYCPGGAASLHGVYGIGRTETYYDLGARILADPERAKRLVPFGYDDVGGELYIDVADQLGRVVYNPNDPDEFYHSADSIEAFLKSLVLEEG